MSFFLKKHPSIEEGPILLSSLMNILDGLYAKYLPKEDVLDIDSLLEGQQELDIVYELILKGIEDMNRPRRKKAFLENIKVRSDKKGLKKDEDILNQTIENLIEIYLLCVAHSTNSLYFDMCIKKMEKSIRLIRKFSMSLNKLIISLINSNNQ